MAALARLCMYQKPTFPANLSKKGAEMCWKWGSPTNQNLQLVYVTSFTHSEPPLTQLSRPALLLYHLLIIPLLRKYPAFYRWTVPLYAECIVAIHYNNTSIILQIPNIHFRPFSSIALVSLPPHIFTCPPCCYNWLMGNKIYNEV